MIEVTKSNFLNHILEKEEISLSSIDHRYDEYKKYIETEFDKWLWNRLNRLTESNPNYIPNLFNTERYADDVFDVYVKPSGMSNTDYGEFVRAFSKLAYRYFNDGDDPVYGPYSAIQEFLKSDFSSRRFKVEMDGFEFTDVTVVFNNDYELMNSYSVKFGNIINIVCQGHCIFEIGHKDAYGWCNDFMCLIDQLVDSIKGLEKCNISCDDYYKNILEFEYIDIYNWLKQNIDEHNWGMMYTSTFENPDGSILLNIKSSRIFTVCFEFRNSTMDYVTSKEILINLDNLDTKEVETLTALSKINNHLKNKEAKIDFDITLNQFFDTLNFDGSRKNILFKIIKNNERIYEGRSIDLLDPTILNMKIKELENIYTIKVQ